VYGYNAPTIGLGTVKSTKNFHFKLKKLYSFNAAIVVNMMRWLNFITEFVTKLIRRVSLVEQELLSLSEHRSSPPGFSRIHVTRSLVLYVCFVDRCLSFCTFLFGHCVELTEPKQIPQHMTL
jgi:hypothetical protein